MAPVGRGPGKPGRLGNGYGPRQLGAALLEETNGLTPGIAAAIELATDPGSGGR